MFYRRIIRGVSGSKKRVKSFSVHREHGASSSRSGHALTETRFARRLLLLHRSNEGLQFPSFLLLGLMKRLVVNRREKDQTFLP